MLNYHSKTETDTHLCCAEWFHHIFVCQNFIIKCVKIHSFEFLPNQHKYTILYNKNQIYSSENKTILRYHTARRYRICSFKETTTIPKSLIG